MRLRAPIAVLGLVVLTSAGCASPGPALVPGLYQNHYVSRLDLRESWYAPHSGKPRFVETADLDKEGERLRSQGYVLLGASRFNQADAVLSPDGSAQVGSALQQGMALRAAVVVERKPEPGRASEASLAPPASIHDTVALDEVPAAPEFELYDYEASYWARPTAPLFGVRVEAVPHHLQGNVGADHGLVVQLVNRLGPAGQAGVREGDVLLALDQVEVADPASFERRIRKHRGQTVSLDLWRQGRFMQLRVSVPKQGH